MAETPTGIYSGRLVADGYGNLLADEGENAGMPVAYHEGSYVFIGLDEPSHNQRHQQNIVGIEATVDESMTDDGSLVNAGNGENMHHFGTLASDPNYEEGATDDRGRVTNTRMQFKPDSVSAKSTGHTDAYTGTGASGSDE